MRWFIESIANADTLTDANCRYYWPASIFKAGELGLGFAHRFSHPGPRHHAATLDSSDATGPSTDQPLGFHHPQGDRTA